MVLFYNGEEIRLNDTIVTDIQFEDENYQSYFPMGDLGYFFWASKALYNEIQNYEGAEVYEEVDLDLHSSWETYQEYSTKFIAGLVRSGALRHLRQNWELVSHGQIPNEPLIIYFSMESPLRVRVISPAGTGTLPPGIGHPAPSTEDETPVEDITETQLSEVEGTESIGEHSQEYNPEEWVLHIKFRPLYFQATFNNLVNLVMRGGEEESRLE